MRALCWGITRWSVRRLLAHVKNLPRDSAFARSVRGEAAYWDETPEMLAVVADILRHQTWALLKAKGADIEAPEMLPRPGQPRPQPKTVSLSEWATTLT